MTVVPVKKVSLVARIVDKDKIMSALQEAGVLHISTLAKRGDDPDNEVELKRAATKLHEINLAIDFLKRFSESPTAKPARVSNPALLLARVNDLRIDYETSSRLITKLKEDIERFRHFGECSASRKALEEAGIYIKLAQLTDEELVTLQEHAVNFHVIQTIGPVTYAVIFTPKEAVVPCHTFDPPVASIAQQKASLQRETSRFVRIDREASELAYHLRTLETLRESFRERYECLVELNKTITIHGLLGISGFIPQSDVYTLKKGLAPFVVALALEDPQAHEDVPVKLKNPKIIKGFESVVRAFSGINYFEMDKTPIVSLLFIFFGALCLLDAGYGFLLLVSGYVVALKIHRDFGQVFMWTGAFAMVMGILCGQVFGLVFAKDIMLNIPPLLSLATDPMVCFKFSLVVGVVAMGLTNLVALYQNGLKTHNLGCVLAVLATITLMIKQSGLLMGNFVDPSPLLLTIAQGFVALCFVSWIAFPEPVFGPQKKLANVLWMLYSGPIGLVQDVLSHMRLFGIALSGSILALVINKIASILPVFVGTLFAPFGHLVVFLLSLLSLYIHSNRLIFLEFGSKCMSGGHTYFKPFARRI